jgi:hypothetical protein
MNEQIQMATTISSTTTNPAVSLSGGIIKHDDTLSMHEEIVYLRHMVSNLMDDKSGFKIRKRKANRFIIVKMPNRFFGLADASSIIKEGLEKNILFIPTTISEDTIKFLPKELITQELILAIKLQ